jgi:hypothetical protein
MGNRLGAVGRCHGDAESEDMGDTRQGVQVPIDFEGHFAVGATRCHPLTITDASSRFTSRPSP